jgi:hypothetical protein
VRALTAAGTASASRAGKRSGEGVEEARLRRKRAIIVRERRRVAVTRVGIREGATVVAERGGLATPTAAVKIFSTELRVRLGLHTGRCVHVMPQQKDLGDVKAVNGKPWQRLVTGDRESRH